MYDSAIPTQSRLGTSAQAAERTFAVRDAMQRLAYNNGELLNTVSVLIDRLHSVTSPEGPSVEGNKSSRPPANCELEAFIEDQTEMVCARIRSLQRLIDRLEI